MRPEAEHSRTLPNGKPISRLGFGCSSIWSKPHFDPQLAQDILTLAVNEGINYFDTAPSYAEGELRLGQFLRAGNRSDLVISTKVGTSADQTRSFRPEDMQASFEASLQRLGVEKVDILYLHGPSQADLNPEVFAFFETLKRQGKITYSGVNSFDPDVVYACKDVQIDCVMLQYSVADARFDGIIEQLRGAGKVVIGGTILGQGVFNLSAFVPRDRKSLWYLLRALKNDPLFVWSGWRLRCRLARTGLPLHEAAVRFAVSNTSLVSCVFGSSRLENVRKNAVAARRILAPEWVRYLRTGRGAPPKGNIR